MPESESQSGSEPESESESVLLLRVCLRVLLDGTSDRAVHFPLLSGQGTDSQAFPVIETQHAGTTSQAGRFSAWFLCFIELDPDLVFGQVTERCRYTAIHLSGTKQTAPIFLKCSGCVLSFSFLFVC